MITVSNVSLNFGGTTLFKDVNLKFTPGNCYGIIGANGAGKSTFLKILSGELEPSTGEVVIPKEMRMSILKQNHFAYNDYSIMDTVIMGNPRLYEIIQEKDALYAKPDFSEEDGILASELEGEFAELNGWDAETEVAKLMSGLGLGDIDPYATVSTLNDRDILSLEAFMEEYCQHAQRPRQDQGAAGAGALRSAGDHSPRRADQPSGYPVHRVVGGIPHGL